MSINMKLILPTTMSPHWKHSKNFPMLLDFICTFFLLNSQHLFRKVNKRKKETGKEDKHALNCGWICLAYWLYNKLAFGLLIIPQISLLYCNQCTSHQIGDVYVLVTFCCQMIYLLAMVTKMVAAWSADLHVLSQWKTSDLKMTFQMWLLRLF